MAVALIIADGHLYFFKSLREAFSMSKRLHFIHAVEARDRDGQWRTVDTVAPGSDCEAEIVGANYCG